MALSESVLSRSSDGEDFVASKEVAVKKYVVRLSEEERGRLEELIRKGKRAGHLLTRARILLKADVSEAGDGWSDSRIAEVLDTRIKELIMTTLRAPVVLLTDGLTGRRRAAAIAFAKKDANAVVVDRKHKAGEALVEELRSHRSKVECINTDVRRENDVRALDDKRLARFDRPDVVLNKAVTEGPVGLITDEIAE